MTAMITSPLNADQPKIGLVLSGGGAKAGAHVGVLQVLDSLNIQVDYIVGTSMGAVVGGLYASGYTGLEIERILTTLEWDSILLNLTDRDHLYYRRKKDDDLFFVDEFIGFKNWQIKFPLGVVQGQQLYQSFKKFTLGEEPIESFDNLNIPFRAIATDLITGNIKVLDSGDLAKTMYASMAVPGIFPPAEIDGTYLVDGATAANLPIETAKQLGADILIVVDVGAPLWEKQEISSFNRVVVQITNFQVQNNTQISKQLLNEQDILIHPHLVDFTATEFNKLQQAIPLGIAAAQLQSDKLSQFSGNSTRILSPPKTTIPLKNIILHNETHLSDKVLYHYLPKPHRTYYTHELEVFFHRLYELQLFDSIEYKRVDDDLHVRVKGKHWGPTFLQSTLRLSTDFEGNDDFVFAAGLTKILINPLAGELRGVATIGNSLGFFGEWYQPISYNLKWYINPKFNVERRVVSFFLNEQEKLRYQQTAYTATLAAGRNFGEWGRMETGLSAATGSLRILVGAFPVLPEYNFNRGYTYVKFEVDTLDNSFFPSHGHASAINYAFYRKSLGDDQNFDQLHFHSVGAVSCHKHTALLAAKYNNTLKGIAPFDAQFRLGGLFQLSGLARHQLHGQQSALLSAIYYYKLKEIDIIPNRPIPFYIGASFESGNTWNETDSLFKHSFRTGGSLFLGTNTLLGPIYLGFGFTEHGKRAMHLYMGKPF